MLHIDATYAVGEVEVLGVVTWDFVILRFGGGFGLGLELELKPGFRFGFGFSPQTCCPKHIFEYFVQKHVVQPHVVGVVSPASDSIVVVAALAGDVTLYPVQIVVNGVVIVIVVVFVIVVLFHILVLVNRIEVEVQLEALESTDRPAGSNVYE